jgi:hypothetical protein
MILSALRVDCAVANSPEINFALVLSRRPEGLTQHNEQLSYYQKHNSC